MSASNSIYLELVDFIASGPTSREVAEFHPSREAQERVMELIEREKESKLNPEEALEREGSPYPSEHVRADQFRLRVAQLQRSPCAARLRFVLANA